MKRKILFSLFSLCLLFVLFFSSVASFGETAEEPLIRIVMFSDLHVEFGLQHNGDPLRPSTEKAIDYVLDTLTDGDGVDVVLVGGDMIGPRGGWDSQTMAKTKHAIHESLSRMTKDNKVLYVSGNHDPEVSLGLGEGKTEEYSGDYSQYMEQSCGEPISALYSEDIRSGLSPYNEILCYRYTIGGMEFIGMNSPYTSEADGIYSTYSGLYADQVEWVSDELAKIGKDKTVFLFSHYPVKSLRTLLSPTSFSPDNQSQEELEQILKEYPNVVYCFGHAHSGETRWAKSRTTELVQVQGMSLAGQGLYQSKNYVDCHMGSMGYYDNPYQPGGLTAEDPMVVQFVMVELYADRMVFQVHNTGEKEAYQGAYEVKPFALARDLAAQLGVTVPESSDTTRETDSSAENSVSSFLSTEAEAGNGFPIPVIAVAVGVLLVGTGVAVVVLLRKKS